MSTVTTGHRIFLVSYQVETIECSCSERLTAERDMTFPDRHLPLVKAWEAHRREAGLTHNAGMHGSARRVTA